MKAEGRGCGMTEEIVALCRAMGASEDQEELLLPLVQAVRSQLAARLRDGTAPEDCGPAFPLAAAMTAMDQLSGMLGGGDEVASFTAGDLTIRKESGSRSGTLSAQAERLLAPWLAGSGFVFQGVDG